MALPNFSSSTKWFLSVHVLEDKGAKSYLEWQMRNVTTEAQAMAAADAVIDILEALTSGTVNRARLSRQIEDLTSPGSESAVSEQIKLFFKIANGDTRSTTVPMPKSSTAGGVLIQEGEVTETNPQLLSFRNQFLDAGGYLTLSGDSALEYLTSVFQVKTSTIR